MVVNRLQSSAGCFDVEGNLGRVYLQGIFYPHLLVCIQNRNPAFSEIIVAGLNHLLRNGRERIVKVPDGASGETVDNIQTKHFGNFSGLDDVCGSPLTDAFRVTIAPDLIRKHSSVADVGVVADRLTNKMCRDGEELQIVFFQQGQFGIAIGLICLVDFDMVAPTGKFKSVVTKGHRLFANVLKCQIGPLAGEEGNGSFHG